ncbi:MAG: hypothetical protein KC417_15075 [Myxococcales bacterium]|nr:hypothetical protein [Myxococcales bacterium]
MLSVSRVRGGIAALVVATTLAACSVNPTQFIPKGFDHPVSTAFVCLDVATGEPHPLSECQAVIESEESSTLNLHALVTQRSRGELAVVDLRTRRLVDTNTLVPGYTFVSVGELPNAVVVIPERPRFAYVANYGTRIIQSLPLNQLRNNLAATNLEIEDLVLDSPPVDMVSSPDGKFLYVALPDEGAVAEIAVDEDGVLGTPRLITLAADVPPSVAQAADDDAYCASCPVAECKGLLSPPGAEPRTPVSLGSSARPVQLFVDSASNRILVADESLPKIHVLELGAAAAEGAPFAPGVPTADVVATPFVPATAKDNADLDGATTQYIYAIDATDGSVLAMDASSGAVLSVETSPGLPADRVRMSAAARTLAIITPDLAGGEVCKSSNSDLADAAGPLNLRGVFLLVGTTDGFIRAVDVYDMDLDCRECSESSLTEVAYYVERHRPRLGARIRQEVTVLGNPSIVVNALAFRPDSSGVTQGAIAPDLHTIDCPDGMRQIFPTITEGTEPLLCATTDPWFAIGQRWRATFEGAIPYTRGGLGRFTEATASRGFDAELPFCEHGVLGEKNVASLAAEEPEAGYAGDLLYIRSELPKATEDDSKCESAFGEDADDKRRLLPIAKASNDHLELDIRASTYAELMRCFPDFVSYEIRTNDAFVVAGASTGVLHRVIASSSLACEVDTTRPRELQPRAYYGVPFSNGHVAFQIDRPVPENDGDQVLSRGDTGYLEFATTNAPYRLAADTGTLPAEIAWSESDQRIYVLDNAGRGFIRLNASDFAVRGQGNLAFR